MEFDAPIFNTDHSIRDGYVNVYEYSGFQSIGLLHITREKAAAVSNEDTVYRIHVRVKQPCQR